MRFLLVDDHSFIREGLKKILSMQFPNAVFEESSTVEDVINKIGTHQYDVVISDLSMPGRSGLDLVKQVKETRPSLPVLVLSMHPEEHYAIRALKAGAWGYLKKSDGATELIAAIHRVLQGRKYISADLAEQLAEDLVGANVKEGKLHESLSPREFDVFKLIAEGKSISEISQQLTLSLSTVSTHRIRILTKMNMKGNAELIKYALQTGIV
ncbi:MAG: response regulator transcription factor [Bacteroidota bacterium]